MHCPIDQTALRRTTLAGDLPAFACDACAGHWLRFGDYLDWRERHPEDHPEVLAEAAPVVGMAEAPRARRCPDCAALLARYDVGHGVTFTLDRCGRCNGIWLDPAEWETLQSRGLHDNLQQVFGPAWQRALREEAQSRRLEEQFARQLGDEDHARAREFGLWLAVHPRRAEILAYLQAQMR